MRRRMLRGLALTGRSVGVAALFTSALAAGVLLHTNTPAFRRIAASVGNTVMGSLFQGKIVVRDVTHLSVGITGRVRATEVTILDPAGKPVLVAKDVDASIDLFRLLDSLAKDGGVFVDIRDARIGEADVDLDIGSAFRPKPASKPALPSIPSKPSPPPVVHVRRASIGKGHVHGPSHAAEPVDGDAGDVEARFDLENDVAKVTLDKAGVTLRTPQVPHQKAPITGSAKGVLEIAIATTHLKGSADLTGAVGSVPVVAHAEIDGDDVDATVDVAEVDPAAIATAFEGVPLTKPASVHAHARGTLPALEVDARARVGPADVTAKGDIDLGPSQTFKLDADLAHVDAQTFGVSTATDISGKVHADGTFGGAPLVQFRVTTAEGTVAQQRIPGATIEGRFEGQHVTAVVKASEPGVDASGKVVVDVIAQTATFDLQARSSSLQRISRAAGIASGAASARAQGKVDFRRKTIKAATTASGDGIEASGFSAKHVSANGTLSGPLAAPVLDIGFAGVDLNISANGKAPLSYPSATGHAKVALESSPRVMDASVSVAHPKGTGEGITASAQGVSVVNGVVETHGLVVTGLGDPLELDARVGSGEWSIRAKSTGVDLHRAATVTGIKELDLAPQDTRASVDVDIRNGSRGAEGHLDVVVRSEKGFVGAGELVAEAHATVDRGKVSGTGRIEAAGFGKVDITRIDLDVPGRLDARSIQRATGVVELRGSVDLSQGAALFAGENVEHVGGIASFEARVERGDPKALPAIRGTVRTEGLEVVLSGDPPSKTITIAGVDLQAHVAWDGHTDDAEVSLLSWDRHGLLGSAGAKARLPLSAWAKDQKRIPGDLEKLDVDVVAEVPERDFRNLPSFLGSMLGDVRGTIASRVRVGGTLGHPRLVASASTHGLRSATNAHGQTLDPLDGALEARWDGQHAAITFAIDERQKQRRRRKGEEPGHLRGLVLLNDIRASDIVHGRPLAELPWHASAEVEVENLKLAAVPGSTMTGVLTGRARIKDLNREPSFEGTAHVANFGAGGAKVETIDLGVHGRDRSLFVQGSIVDRSQGDPSTATLQLASKSLRMKGLGAAWDPAAPTRLDYAVQNGQLALLQPLLKGVASELDGRVDGAGSVTLEGDAQVFEGGLAIHQTSLYVNALGEEITSLSAIAKFDRTGTFRIDDASGKMASGEFRASASGRMKGLQFMGADATIIATKGVPISAEGATFAEATGEVKISTKMSDDRKALLVTVDLPRADVELPDRNTQTLQSLDPDTTIAVGVRRKNGKLDTTAVRKSRGGKQVTTAKAKANAEALVTRMTVTLGDGVHIEGRGLDVMLAGRTLVEIAEEVKVTGQINLSGGTAEVHGRRFHVDRGTITFTDDADPSNPMVVASAYWDSPDRTRVWVEFAGPLKSGNLTLRSEPPYTKNEILSVLIFGRPDPNMAASRSRSSSAGSATAVGGGFLAGDLNRVLSQFDENLDVETDTLSGNRARAKVGRSFFDRRLKVQVGYAPGQTYREPDTTFLFLNWQFIPKWSLLVTNGNKGTSILDVLFQHRY